MNRSRWTVPLAAMLFVVTPLAASEGAAGSDKWMGVPRWILLSINLVIFFGALAYFLGPLLRDYLDGKGREVRDSLAEAKRQQREARDMATKLSGQIAELQKEVEELRIRADREGERERQEILAEAERERARFEVQAEEEVRHRLQQAREELSQHAVALAGRLAQQRVATGMTEADRGRLFDVNLSRLEAKKPTRLAEERNS
ncbi:MAG: hypothetical protein K8J08_11650 [Thermoanaerobaculia bacterium]|nr:hypothetical protein [Thermoanaerobaculia bacterium]